MDMKGVEELKITMQFTYNDIQYSKHFKIFPLALSVPLDELESVFLMRCRELCASFIMKVSQMKNDEERQAYREWLHSE